MNLQTTIQMFGIQVKTINSAIVFVHYDRDNLVDDYVYFYLKALQKNSSHLVFVTTSVLSKSDTLKLSTHCSHIIQRENIGYDFMSYKMGLQSFDYTQYDALLLCNDSVYGPFYPLEPIFETMQESSCDFWGITDNQDMAYHLQSYFLMFKKSLLTHAAFSTFWDNVEILDDKEEIIEKYEVGLTHYFQQNGFKPASYIHFVPTRWQKVSIFISKLTPAKIIHKLSTIIKKEYSIKRIGKLNVTLYFWKSLIIHTKMPFIKIKILRDNPNNMNIDQVEETIAQVSTYDTTLISRHLKRMEIAR